MELSIIVWKVITCKLSGLLVLRKRSISHEIAWESSIAGCFWGVSNLALKLNCVRRSMRGLLCCRWTRQLIYQLSLRIRMFCCKCKIETAAFSTLQRVVALRSWLCEKLGASTLWLKALSLGIEALLFGIELLTGGFSGAFGWGFCASFTHVVFEVDLGTVNFAALNLRVLVIYIWARWHLKSPWTHLARRPSHLCLIVVGWFGSSRSSEGGDLLGPDSALRC